MNCQQFNLVKSYRGIYIYFRGERDNSYVPFTTHDTGKSKVPSFPDCSGLLTFSFTKDAGHRLTEVTVERLQQSLVGTLSKVGKAIAYLPISTVWL